MKITQRGPADTDLSQLVQNDKTVNQAKKNSEPKVQQTGESTRINISKEARQLQRIAELARTGDELRAQKVNHVKEQIAKGQYSADPLQVSKSIIRSEVSRILENK
jgi:flagellar biosynthesis anti-sigma factor FlgM